MKFLGFDITREKRSSLENPAVSISDPAVMALFFGDAVGSAAGELVTVERALGVPAVWAAVNFLSDVIATLPLKLYRRTDNGSEVIAEDPLARILHDAVNPELTSFRWRKGMMTSALTIGRGLTFIERSPSGRVLNLWPDETGSVSITRENGRTFYRTTNTTLGGMPGATYTADEVIDLPFLMSSDGLAHYSPVHVLRNSIGLAIALESYASRFFSAGGVPPLQLIGPVTTPQGAARATAEITEALAKAKATGRNVLTMPQGHELKPIGMDPEKGQMTDARRMQIEEIARIYGLPPHFIQDLSKATFSNIEHQSLALVKYTVGKWVQQWEQELNIKLFGRDDRQRFVKFSLDGLLRGDFATRMTGYATAIQNAIRTPDEIRALEDLAPMGGAAGELHVQGATVPIDRPAPAPAPDVQSSDIGDEPEVVQGSDSLPDTEEDATDEA